MLCRRAAILDLPFIRELAAGTLGEARFRHYMVQDALYLTEFSRVLSLAAAGAPDPSTMVQFDDYARNALTVERTLHATFFHRFGITGDAAVRAEMSPTCFAYTNYLLAAAHREPKRRLVPAPKAMVWKR